MTLKQRRTPFDSLLLHVLLPLLHDSPLRPMLRLCAFWHAPAQSPSALPAAAVEPPTWLPVMDQASVEAEPAVALVRAA